MAANRDLDQMSRTPQAGAQVYPGDLLLRECERLGIPLTDEERCGLEAHDPWTLAGVGTRVNVARLMLAGQPVAAMMSVGNPVDRQLKEVLINGVGTAHATDKPQMDPSGRARIATAADENWQEERVGAARMAGAATPPASVKTVILGLQKAMDVKEPLGRFNAVPQPLRIRAKMVNRPKELTAVEATHRVLLSANHQHHLAKVPAADRAGWIEAFQERWVGGEPFVLTTVNLDQLKHRRFVVDSKKVSELVANPPKDDGKHPIIARYAGKGGKPHVVLDGNHRVEAAKLRGDRTIQAFVQRSVVSELTPAGKDALPKPGEDNYPVNLRKALLQARDLDARGVRYMSSRDLLSPAGPFHLMTYDDLREFSQRAIATDGAPTHKVIERPGMDDYEAEIAELMRDRENPREKLVRERKRLDEDGKVVDGARRRDIAPYAPDADGDDVITDLVKRVRAKAKADRAKGNELMAVMGELFAHNLEHPRTIKKSLGEAMQQAAIATRQDLANQTHASALRTVRMLFD